VRLSCTATGDFVATAAPADDKKCDAVTDDEAIGDDNVANADTMSDADET